MTAIKKTLPSPKPKIRQRPSLLDYLESRLGKSTGRGDEKHFFCPFCIDKLGDESSKRKFGFNIDNGKCYCFRCQYGTSSLERFFRDLNNGALRFIELSIIRGETKPPSRDLAAAVSNILKTENVNNKDLKPVPLPAEYKDLTLCHSLSVRRGHEYLKTRGITPAQIAHYKIGYCPTGRYAQRLIFPVFQNGKQVYFTSRYCGNHDQKGLNPLNEDGSFRRECCLLNYDNAVGAKMVLIVEGAFDMMAHASTVALMGKVMSDVQVSLVEDLAKHGLEEAVVVLDPDASKEADEIYKRLLGRVPRVSILRLGYGDPHDRREELPGLLETRSGFNFSASVRARLTGAK